MGDFSSEHVSGELLELYAAGRLIDYERDSVEEHLLVCCECRERLTETGILASEIRANTAPRTFYIHRTVRLYWSGGSAPRP